MKIFLITLSLVASLAMAQEATKKQDVKKADAKSEMKGMEKKAAMPHHKYSSAAGLQWGPAPAILPAGAQAAVLSGDPALPGEFTLRIKLPAGYKIPPHWHPSTEHVTLISGEVYLGMGEKWDESKGQKLIAGDFIYMAPETRHFAWTKSESVLQLHGTGPWKLIYVNQADDPSPKK